jgi:hypothetical protein
VVTHREETVPDNPACDRGRLHASAPEAGCNRWMACSSSKGGTGASAAVMQPARFRKICGRVLIRRLLFTAETYGDQVQQVIDLSSQ